MNDTNKIASEAWTKIRQQLGMYLLDIGSTKKALAIIRAACEKVERAAHKEGYSAGLADANKLRAHASEPDAKQLAITFHNIYERFAPDFGYETRTETRDFDPTTPNGRLMIAVCDEILKYHLPRAAHAKELSHDEIWDAMHGVTPAHASDKMTRAIRDALDPEWVKEQAENIRAHASDDFKRVQELATKYLELHIAIMGGEGSELTADCIATHEQLLEKVKSMRKEPKQT